jgi:hypothetical protein
MAGKRVHDVFPAETFMDDGYPFYQRLVESPKFKRRSQAFYKEER